jgi:hypothetical protein
MGLVRGEDSETYPQSSHILQALQVDRCLGKPHALGLSPEPMPEILNAPYYLGVLIPGMGKGHDQMVVGLSHGGSAAGKYLLAFFIGINNSLIRFLVVFFHPGQQSGPKIEAYPCIIVDDIDDILFFIEDPGRGVGGITLGRNTLIPVMIGISGILDLDLSEPGVFPGGLIKMTVDADV